MKYLLVIALALIVFWWLRNNRRDDAPPDKAAPRQPSRPMLATEVVACDICHVHLPRAEALPGPHGVYCSDAHRRQAGA